MLRALEARREAPGVTNVVGVLKPALYILYREHCCRHSDEDCEDLAYLAYSTLGVDLDSACEDEG